MFGRKGLVRCLTSDAAVTRGSSRVRTILLAMGAATVGAAGALALKLGERQAPLATASCESPNVLSMLKELNTRLGRIEKALGVGLSAFAVELDKIRAARRANPKNLAMKYFDDGYFAGLPSEHQARLLAIVRTGFENTDSGMGCYAMAPDDYDIFEPFFDPIIRDYHGAKADAVHVTDWDTTAIGEHGVLDVQKLGLEELSMRVRVGRNLANFNLSGSMGQAERISFEQTMLKAFAKLQSMPEYGGRVYSLTPDFGDGKPNPNLISNQEYQGLVQAHIMFKDMDVDPYLKSAGISADWPYGLHMPSEKKNIANKKKRRQKGIKSDKRKTKHAKCCGKILLKLEEQSEHDVFKKKNEKEREE